MTLRSTMTLLACLLCLAPAPLLAQTTSENIRWEDYSTMGADDAPLSGELGRLTVPENRARPDGPTIELAFVRYRSANPDPGPTFFVLAGGPGGSGIDGCIGPASGRMVRLLQYGDVIGLDQRGTGLSVPNLSNGPAFEWELPADLAISAADVVAASSESVERCVAYWSEQGVDLSAYNTAESADDIDDLRAALGLDKIVPWGSSYGSHLGLSYLRRHSDHVTRAVFSKVEGPNHTLKLPSTTEFHLQQLSDLVAADPNFSDTLPNLRGTVGKLLRQLRKEPVTVTVSGESGPVDVSISEFDLAWSLANILGEAFELFELPASIQRLDNGDWSELGAMALENRRGDVYSAMSLMMDYASGATTSRLKRIRREAKDRSNLLSDAVNMPYPGSWEHCPEADLGDTFRGPLRCDVPVLFVSGTLDARTPPLNVEEILDGFSAGVHVIVENVGHEGLEMLSPEYREVLAAFLRGEAVESQTIAMQALPFREFSP